MEDSLLTFDTFRTISSTASTVTGFGAWTHHSLFRRWSLVDLGLFLGGSYFKMCLFNDFRYYILLVCLSYSEQTCILKYGFE